MRTTPARAPRALGAIAAITVTVLTAGLVGAPAHAADADPFTIVLIPDTQNYTYSNRTAFLNGQMDWIVSSRSTLNTKFVAHLGDLVSDYPNTSQWQIISDSMKRLDDAGVPNSVIPGNHDFDNVTRAVGPYDTYFPVSRYAQAAWNSPTVQYGGYLGQNQFGTDAADRKNMDSYALLTAGGEDFLILNLEFEAPDYALAWADRVIAAHPDRTVIMVTHSFLTLSGSRRTSAQSSGGTPPSAIWTDFVFTHCQIRMVLSGHEHNGDLGESRRTDPNSCGQPVHQMLSDFQDRANGGNGWLRYLTFDPVAGTVTAKTYSTVLDQFETDPSSQFTLPFPLNEAPPANIPPVADVAILSTSGRTVNFSGTASRDVDGTIASYAWDFGDGTSGAGATPSRTYGADGAYTVTLTVTDDDGARDTRSRSVTVTTAPPPPTQEVIASDTFSRTVSNGWGAAVVGGAWTVPTGAAQLSVDGSAGGFSLGPGNTREARLPSLSVTKTVTDVQVSSNAVPTGGAATATVIGRLASTGDNYAARVRFEPNGVLRMYLLRGETSLNGSGYIAPGTYAAGQVVNVRLSVRGTNPTTVAAKIWKVGATEPPNWLAQTTETTAALQSPGIVVMRTSLSGSVTTSSVRLSFDNLVVTTGDAPTPPPVNVAPVARFTSGTSNLTVNVDGASSTDSDGTIASYAWAFGTTGIGTGPTAAYTFSAAGTYPVTLTVTDDKGATGTITQNVTVTAPPPVNVAPLARFTSGTSNLTVNVDGASSTDSDGTIASYAWAFGTTGIGTGPTAGYTFPAAGTYPVTLTVTDDKGATGTITQNVTVTAPPSPSPVLAADTFERTISNGWGVAETGGAWTTLWGSASSLSVASGQGTMTLRPADTREARLDATSTTDALLSITWSSNIASVGGAASLTLIGREVGSGTYSVRIRLEPGGVVRMYLLRNEIALGTYVVPGTYPPGQQLNVLASVTGTSPTVVRGKVWVRGTTEPAAWQATGTDTTAALQAAGRIGVKASVSGSSTNATTILRFDDFSATKP